MGCYLALDNVSSVERISGSMEQLPLRAALMVAGDLNMNISDPEGVNWDKKNVAELADAGLEDMFCHFLLHRIPWKWYGRSWSTLW